MDQEERYLVPQNGAEFAVIIGASFDSIDLESLQTLNYEAVALPESDWAPFVDAGLIMAVRTTEGNYAKMEVTGFEPKSGVDRYDLKLRYVLYD